MKKKECLSARKWTGTWIEPEQENAFREPDLNFEQMVAAQMSGEPSESHLKCVKHLHRVVRLENKEGELPVSAVIYASAHGVYDLIINGTKADERLLAPETTNYQKLLWYQRYDITDLSDGSDRLCIDVLLGDGWWIGRLGMGGSSCNYGERLGFLMDLELTYPDGSVTVIGSDEQFLACDSFIRYSDLYIGEMQDGRAFDFIDATKGCPPKETIMDEQYRLLDGDGSNERKRPVWKPCRCVSFPLDHLAQQTLAPVQVIREIPMTGYVENPAQDLVADFGQVMAGVVRIRVNAPAGTVITLEHGEVLDKDGNYLNNIKGLYKDQKTRFLCAGGEQAFVPRFTYQGFRYVRITGIEKENILELTALQYGTPLKKLAEFSTDCEPLNRLQQAIENSTVSNMISIPTDCPQREKLGWTGDINIFTRTGGFLYDLQDILKNWLLQVRLDQMPDGEIPVVVPNHPYQDRMQRGMSGGTNSSAAWSDCIVFMPLELYRLYGDLSFLTDNFDAMEKWMSYVKKQLKEDLWTGRFHFGDWLIPSLREEPDGVMKGVMATADITGSCYCAMAAAAMAKVCRILQEKAEQCKAEPLKEPDDYKRRAEHYEKLSEKVCRAIVRTYVREDGTVGMPEGRQLQGLYVMVLKTGAVKDPELKAKLLAHLVSMIEAGEYTLDCGFSSIGFLLDVLYENGFCKEAYRVLFSQKAPSWLYMIAHGATTIWENWRAVLEDGTVTDSSYNHYAYGCVGEFMYRHIGGIEALEPGFARVRIAPDLDCGLGSCRISRLIPAASKDEAKDDGQRKITVAWELSGNQSSGKGIVHVKIPEGVTAQLDLPGLQKELAPGSYEFQV